MIPYFDALHRLPIILGDDLASAAAWPADGPQWSALAAAAARHGLAGLLLERANASDVAIPHPARRRLDRAAFAIAAENLHFLRELERLLAGFHHAGIPVLLLKGAALNLTTYPRPNLRPMSDLDLLVPHRDAHRAQSVLEEMGCTRGAPLLREDFFPRFYYETEYFSPGPRPVRIDLHARPFRPLRYACTVSEREFWQNAVTVPCGSTTALVPRPEVMFLHLAAHAAFHGGTQLLWLHDLHRFAAVHHDHLDSDKTMSLARRWSLDAAYSHAVRQARKVQGSFSPNLFHGKLRFPRPRLRDRLILATAPQDARRPLRHLLTTLVTTPDFRLRCGYLFAHLWPDRAHLAEKLPASPGWTAQFRRWMSFIPRAVRAFA